MCYDIVLADLYDGSNPLSWLTPTALRRMKAVLRPRGTLAVNVVAHYAGPHARLAHGIIGALRENYGHVRAFVDRDPAIDPLLPTNLLLVASDAPAAFEPPPLPDDPEDAPPGTAPHLHASFLDWEPPMLTQAASAEPVRVLLDPSEFAVEQAEVRTVMEGIQRELMPAAGWELVELERARHRESAKAAGRTQRDEL